MRTYILVVVSLMIYKSSAEFYSSLGQMEDLVHKERKLINALDEYILDVEGDLNKIKELARILRLRSKSVLSNVDGFLGHPVNQYHLMRRLSSEWNDVEEIISADISQSFIQNLTQHRHSLPSDEDVKGTAEAIMRLQDTYRLDTHELANGIVKGSKALDKMSVQDVFSIGRTAYLEEDFYHCALWMREAKQMADNVEDDFMFQILDHLAYCLSQQGNMETAYKLTFEMLKIDPTHARILSNHKHYKTVLGARKKGDDGAVVLEKLGDELSRNSERQQYPEFNLYERLCRDGSDPIKPRIEKKLKCYYWTNGNQPSLLWQPVKMEVLWRSPELVRFYDVINDKEIEMIKSYAKPQLNRATVQNPLTGKLETAHYRVSKSAWLKDRDYSLVNDISKRIQIVTGLEMSTAEELQIANYGVGGQYEPHYDYARDSDGGQFDDDVGNRIATWLFYFTDVEHGGSTVFLQPKLAIKPVKGSAVFWYNLRPSGQGDGRTRHAACPVLIGVKWVGNKWIHERGQEFNRKCGLKSTADNVIN